jgi:hypothetical protein
MLATVHTIFEAPVVAQKELIKHTVEIPFTETEQIKEKEWEDITGEKPSDSKLLLVVPIHNEERCIESFLTTLELSLIPKSLNLKIVFYENGSVDNTFEKLSSLIRERYGAIQIESPYANLSTDLDEKILRAQIGNQTIEILQSNFPSKARALNTVNKIALQEDYPLIVSCDANTFPEYDALAKIYSTAKNNHVLENPEYGGVGLIGARASFSKRSTPEIQTEARNPNKHFVGWFMAWNPQLLSIINEIPEVKSEDFGFKLKCLEKGFQVLNTDIKVFGFMAETKRENEEQQIRYTIGAIQLYERFPELRSLLKDVIYLYRDPVSLFQYISRAKNNPGFKRKFLRVLQYMKINNLAYLLYLTDRNSSTWNEIKTTK